MENARPHNSRRSGQCHEAGKFTRTPHLPCSPDITPINFSLFGTMKQRPKLARVIQPWPSKLTERASDISGNRLSHEASCNDWEIPEPLSVGLNPLASQYPLPAVIWRRTCLCMMHYIVPSWCTNFARNSCGRSFSILFSRGFKIDSPVRSSPTFIPGTLVRLWLSPIYWLKKNHYLRSRPSIERNSDRFPRGICDWAA
jgi:hypothetical protein